MQTVEVQQISSLKTVFFQNPEIISYCSITVSRPTLVQDDPFSWSGGTN